MGDKINAEALAPAREDTVRVLRVIEYVGPRAWVERTISDSINGTKILQVGGQICKINAATIGEYPEILKDLPPSKPDKPPSAYCVGVPLQDGNLGMTHGPFSMIEEALKYIPEQPNSMIVEVEPNKPFKTTHLWDEHLQSWVRI